MILILKRLGAKIIDFVLFLFSGFIFLFIFSFLLSVLLINNLDVNSDLIIWLKSVPTNDFVSFNDYLFAQKHLFMLFGLVGLILVQIHSFLYFAILGRFVHGSLGKYVFHLYLIDANNQPRIGLWRLFFREPLLHIFTLNLAISLITFYIPSLQFLAGVPFYVYLVLFLLNADFWNQLMQIKITDAKM